MQLWDTNSGKLLRYFEGGEQCFWWMALSPDGKLAFAISNQTKGPQHADSKLWETATGKVVYTFPPKIGGLGFSPDGRLAILGKGEVTDGEQKCFVILWSLAENKEVKRLNVVPSKAPNVPGSTELQIGLDGVRFTDDGKKLIAVYSTKLLALWDLETGKEIWCVNTNDLLRSFSLDGQVICMWGSVWDGRTGKCLWEFDPKYPDAADKRE